MSSFTREIFSRQALSTILERQSEESVRGALKAGEFAPENEAHVRGWLNDKERARREAAERTRVSEREEEMEVTRRSVAAAERAAMWAMIAAVVSTISLGISVAIALYSSKPPS